MSTLPDLDAGYFSDSHTGLYILGYVKHNPAANFLCVPLCWFGSLSPDISWVSLSLFFTLLRCNLLKEAILDRPI